MHTIHSPSLATGSRPASCCCCSTVQGANSTPRPAISSTPQFAAATYHDGEQLPGIRMPVMQQLQQNQCQLQQQLQQATQHVQRQSHQSMQQQQHPTLLPKPGNNSSTSSRPFALHQCLSPDLPLDPRAIQQLRDQVAAATTIQQLLQLLPAVVADNNPDSVTRVLLQAVRIHRSSGASEGLQYVQQPTAQVEADTLDSQHQQQHLGQLLQQCDVLVLQCHPRMMFQHVSGVLWSWAQLQWRPGAAATTAAADGIGEGSAGGDSELLRHMTARLKQCKVDHELSGKVPHVGSQLARATTACARLGISNRKVWAKLHIMIQALAHLLTPSEVACCCWGLARSKQAAKTQGVRAAYTALLTRAQHIIGASQQPGNEGFNDGGHLGFSRVGALNVVWAVCVAGVADSAPAGLLEGLVQLVLGKQYRQWRQQQAGITAAAADKTAAEAGDATGSTSLLPHELACLVWSVAAAARHSSRRAQGWQAAWLNLQQQQQHSGSSSGQQSPALQSQQPPPYIDPLLLGYLGDVIKEHLATSSSSGVLARRQVATLAYASALLLQHQQQQHCGGLQQHLLEVIAALWHRAVECGPTGSNLREVHMLLESVAVVTKLQQHQQQPERPWNLDVQHVSAAAAAAVLAAASRRVTSADDAELQGHTAAALLYVMTKLQRFTPATATAAAAQPTGMPSGSSSSSSSCPGGRHNRDDPAAAAAAVAVRLLNSLNSSSLSCLRDQELVMLAAAAGQLAAVKPTSSSSIGSNATTNNSTSTHQQIDIMSEAAADLLNQLALPLAAAAHSLKLRELATAVCGYAAANTPAPQLFDAVSRAVQQREVLDHGSTWGLARLLAAYATVGHTDELLFAAVVDAVMPRLDVMKPKALARVSWALAVAGYHDLEVFRAIGGQILHRSSLAQGGYCARRSTATEGHTPAAAQVNLPDAANSAGRYTAGADGTGVLTGFQPRDTSALAWALGTVGYKDPEPYQVLANTGLKVLKEFSISQLASLLWGLAAAGAYHEDLLSKVTELLGASRDDGILRDSQQQQQGVLPAVLYGASAADVATLAWSLSELRCSSPAVLQACVVHFMGISEQYSSTDAADLAWALLASGWDTQWLAAQRMNSNSSCTGSQVTQHDDSGQQCSNQVKHSSEVVALLQMLMEVVLSDLDQLTPQQLANSLLVAAVAEAAADNTCQVLWVGQQQPWQQQMLLCMAGWGSGAFTAADGVKLLWAQLLLGGALTGQQQDLQSQQQRHLQTAVVRKLLSAGARAAVRSTALVCSSSFCQEVMTVVNSMNGLTAQPAVSAVAAAKAAAQAAQKVSQVLVPSKDEHQGSAAAAEVASGDDLPAVLWDQLGRETTAQLLGHLVVQLDTAAVTKDRNGSAKREVLVFLVASSQLNRTAGLMNSGISQDTDTYAQPVASADPLLAATAVGQGWLQQVTGCAGVIARLLLPQLRCYSGYVVVTEAQWLQWAAAGGQEAQAAALQRLLRSSIN